LWICQHIEVSRGKWVNFCNVYVGNCFSGTLKALELENQVLKLRNAQLELAGNTETIKGWFDSRAAKSLFECTDSIA
jgi:hypothetical protein